MTPRRSLSSNAKPTCVRSADTSHGGSYSNASKCRSPTCRLYLYQSTNFGTGALRPPERGQKLSRSCAADRSTSKKEQQQRRLRAGQRRSRRSAANRQVLRNRQQSSRARLLLEIGRAHV